jgi:leader peptidase (prepilin peptidase)/N-methyltransferase
MAAEVVSATATPLILVLGGLLGAGAGLVASRLAATWTALRPVPVPRVTVRPTLSALVHGVVLASVVWRWGVSLGTVPLVGLAWVVLLAADVDLRAHVIPDRLTLRAPLGLGVLLVAVTLTGDGAGVGAGRLVASGIAAVVLPGALLVTSRVFQRVRAEVGVGLGDVKLAIAIGLVLGWRGAGLVLLAVLVAFVASAAVALGLLATRRLTLRDRLPFGPHLAVGTVAALVGGHPAAGWVGAGPIG